MIDRRAQRDNSISIFRIIAVVCAVCVLVYFIFASATGIEPIATVVACALLCIFLCIFIYLTLNPDSVRSQYTEETLSVASAMLEDIKGGLTQESALLVCRRILPETRAMTVAITDENNVLACAGEFEEKLLPDSPIHTLATRYVIEARHRAVVQPRGGRGGFGWLAQPSSRRYHRAHQGGRPYRRHAQVLLQDPARRRPYPVCARLGLCRDPVHAARHPRARGAKKNSRPAPRFVPCKRRSTRTFCLTRSTPSRRLRVPTRCAPANCCASSPRSIAPRSTTRGRLSRSRARLPQTKRYLTFEKARFGEDRVLATFDVSEDVEDTLVPAFVIQPIVENAVRHGMGDGDAPADRCDRPSRRRRRNPDCRGRQRRGHGRGYRRQLFDERSARPDASSPQGGGAGVAMHNISERIHRFLWTALLYARRIGAGQGHQSAPAS